MSDFTVGQRVMLKDTVYCGDGLGYIKEIKPLGDRKYQVTNQRPGTDDPFVWGAWVTPDDIAGAAMSERSERMTEEQPPDTIAVVLRPGRTDEGSLIASVDELDTGTRLRQLEALRDEGAITDDEYAATRKAILESMAE